MRKKCYRYFGGLLQTQENWLNKMANEGHRLVTVDKMLYQFEQSNPKQVQYKVEFIGHKSPKESKEYHDFLEDMGYKVFYKNINLNYSIGKVKYRPWAEKGGRIATNRTTYNKELLLIEKDKDGKPFDLHTSFEDKEQYYRHIRNPWLSLLILFGISAFIYRTTIFGFLALIALIPVIFYQYQILKLKKEAKTKEW